MIRHLNETDLTEILSVWLNTNLQAHSFIPAEYWKENYDIVKQMLPQAEVYVYEQNGHIAGFIGLMEQEIAGLFVQDTLQSKGIGKQLLDYVKKRKSCLTLHAYRKNQRAVQFYLREQFYIQSQETDSSTGEREYVMKWELKADRMADETAFQQ
ncbi:MAG: N-acetyltransferase [Butyricicoccus sp.]|nr:N-acetyltransferase [Butyricicoccus sp.]